MTNWEQRLQFMRGGLSDEPRETPNDGSVLTPRDNPRARANADEKWERGARNGHNGKNTNTRARGAVLACQARVMAHVRAHI